MELENRKQLIAETKYRIDELNHLIVACNDVRAQYEKEIRFHKDNLKKWGANEQKEKAS